MLQCYRWPKGLSDDEILERLMELNQKQAAAQVGGLVEIEGDEK